LFYTDDPDLAIDAWSQAEVDGHNGQYTIDDLLEQRVYYVRMRANNIDAPGVLSDTHEKTTHIKREYYCSTYLYPNVAFSTTAEHCRDAT
jgi:hypothetical protein